jgi:hypothetical protein
MLIHNLENWDDITSKTIKDHRLGQLEANIFPCHSTMMQTSSKFHATAGDALGCNFKDGTKTYLCQQVPKLKN